MGTQRWHIAGYDGLKQFFAHSISTSATSEDEIRVLLQRLCAKFLTAQEIVECSDPHERSTALDVNADEGAKRRTLTVGSNPHFTATMFEANEDRSLGPTVHSAPPVAPFDYD